MWEEDKCFDFYLYNNIFAWIIIINYSEVIIHEILFIKVH